MGCCNLFGGRSPEQNPNKFDGGARVAHKKFYSDKALPNKTLKRIGGGVGFGFRRGYPEKSLKV